MLVDDNMINNLIMKKIISNVDKQVNVRDFTLPEEAFNSLPEVNPTVIFLDLNMPVMNGWQFLNKMTEKQWNYQVYILTSSTSELDRIRSSNYPNVAGYLHKPLTKEALTSILQTA